MADVFQMPTAPIRLNTRNEWLHGDDLIQSRVAALFSRSVQVQDDGSYAVRVGQDCQGVRVDDTAFWVSSMVMDTAGGDPSHAGSGTRLTQVRLSLSDGQSEWLNPATLMQSADNALYCRIVRQGFAVPCRFSPQQYHALTLYAHHTQEGYALEIEGKDYLIGRYDRRPRPCQND